MEQRLYEIDQSLEKLHAERRKLTEELYYESVKAKTSMYRGGKPKNPGVYHYSSTDVAHIGGSLGYWDGVRWHSITGWGDFTDRGKPIVWFGEGRQRGQPLSAKQLRDEKIDPALLGE